MKIGIMQPYFFPYIGYFQLIKAVDKYVIYDDVNYIKGGWINRNFILLNGEKFRFNLILSGASPNKLINEVFVSDNQTKFLKTIEAAYKKAPYFLTIFPLIDEIINFKDKNLARYVGNSIIKISEYLKINTNFIYSSEIDKKNNLLRAEAKVINICKQLAATEYYNAIGGVDLYNREAFEEQEISLHFVKTENASYKQFENEFVSYLSIIDVLMFNSVYEINEMLDDFKLL